MIKPGRPGLDSPAVESSLPQVPFYPPLPQQGTEIRTPEPSSRLSDKYRIPKYLKSQADFRLLQIPRGLVRVSRVDRNKMEEWCWYLRLLVRRWVHRRQRRRREPIMSPSVGNVASQALRPQVEALKAEVERLQWMVLPNDAPPEYVG
jgi:hypothetical protein